MAGVGWWWIASNLLWNNRLLRCILTIVLLRNNRMLVPQSAFLHGQPRLLGTNCDNATYSPVSCVSSYWHLCLCIGWWLAGIVGLVGLLDDLLVLVIVLFYLAMLYRSTLLLHHGGHAQWGNLYILLPVLTMGSWKPVECCKARFWKVPTRRGFQVTYSRVLSVARKFLPHLPTNPHTLRYHPALSVKEVGYYWLLTDYATAVGQLHSNLRTYRTEWTLTVYWDSLAAAFFPDWARLCARDSLLKAFYTNSFQVCPGKGCKAPPLLVNSFP